jgi:hypothetical protein
MPFFSHNFENPTQSELKQSIKLNLNSTQFEKIQLKKKN